MRDSISPLMLCAGVGGGTMRARAVCVHAALKLAVKLLSVYEKRGDVDAALSVTTFYVTLFVYECMPSVPGKSGPVPCNAKRGGLLHHSSLFYLFKRRLSCECSYSVFNKNLLSRSKLQGCFRNLCDNIYITAIFLLNTKVLSFLVSPYSENECHVPSNVFVRHRCPFRYVVPHLFTKLVIYVTQALWLRYIHKKEKYPIRYLATTTQAQCLTSSLDGAVNVRNDRLIHLLVQVLRESIAGMRPLLCNEDMEVQERAHNASALLSLVLRRLNADDELLTDAAPQGQTVGELVQHDR